MPEHLANERALGVAFIAAALAAAAAVPLLVTAPGSASAPYAVALLFAALIGAYCLNVTTGLPWLADRPESVDGIGVATKLVEALGFVLALQLNPTPGRRDSLGHKEARP